MLSGKTGHVPRYRGTTVTLLEPSAIGLVAERRQSMHGAPTRLLRSNRRLLPRKIQNADRVLALFCALPLVACAVPAPPPRERRDPGASPAPAASSAALPPSLPAAPTAIASAPPVTLPPYPEAWISEAENANRDHRCRGLVYKRGCAGTRTGWVTVDMTLAPDGKVIGVELIENTIGLEPEVVWGCLKKNLPQWKVHAPEGVSPIFRLKLGFGDKC